MTGRSVGDVPTDLMLRSLRRAAEGGPDVRLYVTSSDGKVLKSLAVTLRDAQGDVFGILGLNFDVSGLVQTQRTLANLAAVGRHGGEALPETEEIFADDIRDVVAGMVAKILNEMGKTPAAMSRDEKMEVVKRLEERGAFLVKRSAEQVADALDLSRYTIFSYLKEIRRPGRRRPRRPPARGRRARRARRDLRPRHDRMDERAAHAATVDALYEIIATQARGLSPSSASSRTPARRPS